MKENVTEKRSLRDELIREGLNFLNAHSIEELTMRKMAELCHVTPHAIYNYFRNKDEFVNALNDAVMSELNTYTMNVLVNSSGNLSEKISKFADAYLTLVEKYPYHLKVLYFKKNAPYYEIDARGAHPVFKGRYPGFPNLKTLNKMCSMPPFVLKGLLKLGTISGRLKKASSELALEEDAPDVVIGQLLMFSFINGLQCRMHSGMLTMENKEQSVDAMLQILFSRLF
ncbi:MAG: TetR/AcrR family transcriptional regulator [Christensenella sp.]